MLKFLNSTSGRGASWTAISFAASYAIRLLSTLILTRLLAPDVFGLINLTWVFVGALTMLSDIGIVPSVIRSQRGDEKQFLDTAWTLQAARGICIGALTALIAWPVSVIYKEPQLFPVLCAIAVIPLIDGIASISIATCRRHVQLKQIALLEMSAQIFVVCVNVILAWWLRSVWSLALGSIAGALFKMVLSYIFLPRYTPRISLDKNAAIEIVKFGRWILLGTLFTYLGGQGSTAIMGLEVSMDTLGKITIATTIAWALSSLVLRLLGQVVFPIMSRHYREGKPLSHPVKKVKKIITFGVLPVFLILSFGSQTLIDLLYDPRYAAAGGFLSLLALNGAINSLSMPYQNAMLASGDSKAHAIVMAIYSASRIALMFIGGHFYGIYGMLTGLGIGGLITTGVSIYMSRKRGVGNFNYDLISIAVILPAYAYALTTLKPV